MNTIPGTWALTMRTPIGSIQAQMTFTSDGTTVTGTAVGKSETVQLRNVTVEPTDAGNRITWSQSITKPLRLNLDFDVIVDGEEMRGHSRAGRFPKSIVTGRRISAR